MRPLLAAAFLAFLSLAAVPAQAQLEDVDLGPASRECGLVVVHSGPPRIQGWPILGILTLDPDGCVRDLVRGVCAELSVQCPI